MWQPVYIDIWVRWLSIRLCPCLRCCGCKSELNAGIIFLDVQLTCNNVNVDTTVYRKPTNSDIYIHWLSHAPKRWKIGTLKAILYRAYKVCSNIKLRDEELKRIKTTFHDINEYPLHIINRAIRDIEGGTANQDKEKTHSILCLPYKGDKGHRLLSALRRKIEENGDINIQ